MKVKYSFLMVLFLNYFYSSGTIAGNVENKVKELAALQKKIKKFSLSINDLKTKKGVLLSELKKLEINYAKSSVILNQFESQIRSINQDLIKTKHQVQKKQQEIDAQKSGLKNQVKAAYVLGGNERLKLLLNQQDPARSGRMMVYYDYLNNSRLEKIATIDSNLQQLYDLERQYEDETALLEITREQKKLEQSVLLKTQADRKKLLDKFNKQFTAQKSKLKSFKISEKRLKLLISSLQNTVDSFVINTGPVKAFSQLKGKLHWPVKGVLKKKFGAKRSDSTWDGVLIDAREGTEIRAISQGRVVYADWLRGYGLLTIIEHGKGYMSLYAFNQSLYKSVGEKVNMGEVIAAVGKSGGQSSAGLYFSIRKKGKPVNPVKWCRKIRRGKVG